MPLVMPRFHLPSSVTGTLCHQDLDLALSQRAQAKVDKHREGYAAPGLRHAFLTAVIPTSGRIRGELLFHLFPPCDRKTFLGGWCWVRLPVGELAWLLTFWVAGAGFDWHQEQHLEFIDAAAAHMSAYDDNPRAQARAILGTRGRQSHSHILDPKPSARWWLQNSMIRAICV